MSQYIKTPGGIALVVASLANLPPSASDGALAVTRDTATEYYFDAPSASWIPTGGGGGGGGSVTSFSFTDANGVSGVVTNPTTTPNLTLSLGAITPSSVAATGTVSGSNLSGTNTGDVTLGTANGLSLAGQVLSLQLADATHTGALSSADWNTFNSKQPAGSYITALTGDATASGPGSVPLTLATVNGSPGSFGSASQSLSATVNGKGLITSLSAQSIQIAESQVTNLVSDLAAKQSTTLTNAHILVGNGSNIAADVAMSGDVTVTNTGATAVANAPNDFYVNFISGDDTAGTGSITKPWKTLQHAYNSVSPSINSPVVLHLSGGNNDSDVGTITGKPNVSLVSDYAIQVSRPLTISGGTTNDGITFTNIIFLGAVTWIRNDNSAIGVQLFNSEFFSGPIIRQEGAGSANVLAFYSTFVNSEFQLPNAFGVFQGCNFLGTTTFHDSGSNTYFEFLGGYSSSAMTIAGGVNPAYFAGMAIDVPFGASLTTSTTGSGTPTIQTDAASVPPTISGPNTLNLTSYAQHESYTAAVPGDWVSPPVQVAQALDELAAAITGGGTAPYHVNDFTLSGTDITNQFVTLSSAPATVSKTVLQVVGGVVQDYGVDYSISGTTLTFLGDLATGGNAALVAGDKLIVQFN